MISSRSDLFDLVVMFQCFEWDVKCWEEKQKKCMRLELCIYANKAYE